MSNELSAVDKTLSLIERVALDPQSDVAKLEKMIELQERVMKIQAKQAFDSAMVNAQANMPAIDKFKKGHNSSYAPLDYIMSIVTPVLKSNGLFIRWTSEPLDIGLKVTCICTHTNGHCETASMNVREDKGGSKSDIQGMGSAFTYAKRYTLSALLGLVLTDDLDGSRISLKITDAQAQMIHNKLKFFKPEALEAFKAKIGCEVEEIDRGAFTYWIGFIDNQLNKAIAK
jgi:hypothetical protein